MNKRLKLSSIFNFFGNIQINGDKSISHRALIFSSIAIGTSKIDNLSNGLDVASTRKAMEMLGVNIKEDDKSQSIYVEGVSLHGLSEPNNAINLGNSGTSTRLLMGLLSATNFNSFIYGDESLSKRPMGRVIDPLRKMGVNFVSSSNESLPLAILGNENLRSSDYHSPISSAQVKSSFILASFYSQGISKFTEPIMSRNHSEIMLSAMGANLTCYDDKNTQNYTVKIEPFPNLKAMDVSIPGDPSSAAFIIAIALLAKDANILLENICINDTRIGFISILKNMGANIEFENTRTSCGEKVADIRVLSSNLHGVTVESSQASSAIDEYPILFILAAFAKGDSAFYGLEELRVKESDRLEVMSSYLAQAGISLSVQNNNLFISGSDMIQENSNKMVVNSHHDHRIAMSFIVFSLFTRMEITITSLETIDTSFPNFFDIINQHANYDQ